MSAPSVIGKLGFSEPMAARPRFHANDISRDVLNVVPRAVEIEDCAHRPVAPSLDAEGFCLVPHQSGVRDFRDRAEIERVHVEEIRQLLLAVSGADHVAVTSAGVLRFGGEVERFRRVEQLAPGALRPRGRERRDGEQLLRALPSRQRAEPCAGRRSTTCGAC